MADDDSYICMFCSSDITPTQESMTVPNLGVLVHTACYKRERGDDAEESAA
jgi:ribosomal protein L24E